MFPYFSGLFQQLKKTNVREKTYKWRKRKKCAKLVAKGNIFFLPNAGIQICKYTYYGK